MLDQPNAPKGNKAAKGPALDFQTHLAALEAAGLVVRVDRPIDKDSELHPLVRWQFQGGLPENERRAFLFTNVVDSNGKKYDMPVVVGALAASPEIYAIGMGKPVEEIGNAWINRRTVYEHEGEAQALIDPLHGRYWRVENPRKLSEVGDPVGYKLMPGENVAPMALPGSDIRPHSLCLRQAASRRPPIHSRASPKRETEPPR